MPESRGSRNDKGLWKLLKQGLLKQGRSLLELADLKEKGCSVGSFPLKTTKHKEGSDGQGSLST